MARSEQVRPARADARRNREKLLEAALEAFARTGIDASLEAIARQAGLGIGTLYRHFPTREALALAAYRHEVEQVCEAADQLLLTLPPDAALREWMARFSEYIATKRGMAGVLKAVVSDPQQFHAELNLRERMMAALGTLMRRGTEAGLIRGDVDAEVVMLAMSGTWQASAGHDEKHQTARLLDLLMDGLRATGQERGLEYGSNR